ncbi:hypothetical protein [Methanosarcina horonobensis]|nr:hypothetical protein [Methanosarcina horonobensis]
MTDKPEGPTEGSTGPTEGSTGPTEVSYNEWNGKIIPDIGGTSNTGGTSDTGVCYYDWKGTVLDNLTGTYNPDYTYFMVTLYVKNDASQPVSTNAWYWKLVVDGVEYSRDMNSFGSTYQTPVEIQNGGEKETRIIYCLNSIPSEAEVIYKRPSTPIMERIKHY